jgi:hypothetical protein
MPDESPDAELVGMFRRDIGQIELPPRGTWRPQASAVRVAPSWIAPVIVATAVLVVAVLAGGWLRSVRTPVASPVATSSISPKDQSPPPGYTAPPGPHRYPARTAAEVLAGMATDPFLTGASGSFDTSRLRTPVLLKALRPTDLDVWLVPGMTDGAYAVYVDPDGLTRGTVIWATSALVSVPPISEADARTIARSAIADVERAELVWLRLDPRSGFSADEFSPIWRLVSTAGATVFVFSDRRLLSGSEMARLVG